VEEEEEEERHNKVAKTTCVTGCTLLTTNYRKGLLPPFGCEHFGFFVKGGDKCG
jgi:hypothetical protein